MAEEMSAPNPIINGTGKAAFGKNQFCTWNTTDGSISICTIQNTGVQNSLTFLVSGAPPSIMVTYQGQSVPFNGQFTLLPNQPTINVTASGLFQGTQVTITNISSLPATCSVNVVTA